MNRTLVLAALFLLGFYSNAVAAQVDEGRMKVGLVLSGGGARGGAHIGVLEALEELGVQVDLIAGTSMGAVVGGLYAAGYSADEIKRLLEETDWEVALTDDPERPRRTMRTKEVESEFLIPYRIGFNRGRLQMPLGVIAGQHLDQILQRMLLPVSQVRHFDDLPIPFRAVATDLETGEEVVLADGSLANALRASMSVPGVFAPVTVGDRLLVDGGMANNLPVSVARDMGAEVIIAVDISTPLLEESELTSVLDVTFQLTNFLTRRNTEQAIASLGPGDLLIVPELGDFGSADFADAVTIVGIGREASLAQGERLLELAASAGPRARRDVEAPPPGVIQFIELNNTSVLGDELVLSWLGIREGDPLDIEQLDRGVDNVYALDVFESVTYDFVRNEQGEAGIRINARPRRWGPNYLQFGLELATDSLGGDDFLMGAAYTRNAMNRLGGELRVVGSVGREGKLSINLYQPIDFEARWFVEPEVYYLRRTYAIWEEEDKVAEYEVDTWGGQLGLGRNFGPSNQARLSYLFAAGNADLRVGSPLQSFADKVEIGELVPEYRHDSLDSPWFPTSGMLHLLRYRWARESLGASADFSQATARGSMAWTWGRNSLLLSYLAGYSPDDDVPIERWYRLGGFGQLSGLAPNQISGRHAALGTLAAFRRLNDIKLFPAYAGLTLEAGNVWQFQGQAGFDDLRYATSLFLGAESPLGPLYFAVGYASGGEVAAYFYIGNPWKLASFE